MNFKRAKLPYASHHEHQEYDRSYFKTLAWMYACLHKNELSTQVLLSQVNVGYLPPITDSPTEVEVIYTAIYRSLDMNELDKKFIFLEVAQATYMKVLDAMF